jgi:hypothetical protein
MHRPWLVLLLLQRNARLLLLQRNARLYLGSVIRAPNTSYFMFL